MTSASPTPLSGVLGLTDTDCFLRSHNFVRVILLALVLVSLDPVLFVLVLVSLEVVLAACSALVLLLTRAFALILIFLLVLV